MSAETTQEPRTAAAERAGQVGQAEIREEPQALPAGDSGPPQGTPPLEPPRRGRGGKPSRGWWWLQVFAALLMLAGALLGLAAATKEGRR